MARWWLFGLIAVAAGAHLAGMARTPLPAQDGLKFLRAAGAFQTEGFGDAVRGLDQHPGYPIAVALAEPIAARVMGDGPDAWRIAAQGVSLLAHFAALIPLWWLARDWLGDRVARWSVAGWLVLPLPAGLGHDTLSDPLALLGFLAALALGGRVLKTGQMRWGIGCGLAAGLAFWVRPEMALIAAAVGTAAVIAGPGAHWRRLGLAGATALALALPVGAYAAIKGSLSEKLALRTVTEDAGESPRATIKRLPPGLDDPRWDFSPKEETGRLSVEGWKGAVVAVPENLAEALTPAGLALAALGLAVHRRRDRAGFALTLIYLGAFGTILARHAASLGYLSGRHVLTMAAILAPWGAAGGLWLWDNLPRFRLGPLLPKAASLLAGGRQVQPIPCVLIMLAVVLPARGEHPTRWGHLAAGLWLRDHATEGDAVLDTRGWARFISGRPGYDAWHVGQALSDDRLAYVVVGADELSAPSKRAATLRAVLEKAGDPVAAFPRREGDPGRDILVYRFHPPRSWEGLSP